MNSAWFMHMGATLYGVNLAVGAGVQLGWFRAGGLHHWLYALVLSSSLAAAVVHRAPPLLLTLTALLLLPFMKVGTARHPVIAVVGALGYLGAYWT